MSADITVSWNSDIKGKGEFLRSESSFRDWIRKDGSTPFQPEPNRYHLYVSYACPWAHRTLIMRQLKGLEKIITVDVVDYLLDRSKGWTLSGTSPQSTVDTVNGCKTLRDVYLLANPNYSGKITVPVLFDKKRNTIINNESSEIIRMLNSEFNEWATPDGRVPDFYPEELREKIAEVNPWIYSNINDGVYKCGFAQSQESYNENFHLLFDSLDRVEKILSQNRYLTGDRFTEADIRLWTTLVRFDPVYNTHFKCNKRRVIDYRNMWAYVREIYQMPGIADTVNMFHIKNHYYRSHTHINPFGIVPLGPEIDYTIPHKRNEMFTH